VSLCVCVGVCVSDVCVMCVMCVWLECVRGECLSVWCVC